MQAVTVRYPVHTCYGVMELERSLASQQIVHKDILSTWLIDQTLAVYTVEYLLLSVA